MRFAGLLYRALNPIYARELLSGRGAALHGGRFNARGLPALYTSLTILGAVREANQAGHLQPTTLVSYEADIDPVFDAGDAAALAMLGSSMAQLAADTWRDEMRQHGRSRTQVLAQKLTAAGFHGLLVPSFARHASPDARNLVLWRWSDALPHRLRVIDDEGRLGRA